MTERSEAIEAGRVDRQCDHDRLEVDRLVRTLSSTADRLRAIVTRNTETVDARTLTSEEEVPGCTSCARRVKKDGKTYGPHFAPVYEKAKKRGLCRWCYDYALANDDAHPPVEACDKYHRQGARAAGVWLADNQPVKVAS